MRRGCFISTFLLAGVVSAAMPVLEPAFSSAQVEKGVPVLEWTKNADGSETTVLTKTVAGLDLDGVKFTRASAEKDGRATVTFTVENVTKELRYASFGWRTTFSVRDGNDRNWFPTTDNVLDFTSQNSLWGYYTRPGAWVFSLVEPWFAAYNPGHRTGFAFLFDFNSLSAAYGAPDMKTRGVIFDGGLLPPGRRFSVTTVVRELRGLPSLATVNDRFAAGFAGSATSPSLDVLAFEDLKIQGMARQTDVNGVKLGETQVAVELKKSEARSIAIVKSVKPTTQTILSATLNLSTPSTPSNPSNPSNPSSPSNPSNPTPIAFEYFRENGFRMASLPMVPAVWPHHRPLPAKVLPEGAVVEQVAKDKALLLFGFYANFFRFEEIFPELTFTTVPVAPAGLSDVPPASTIGEYRYVFLGDVNEEGVRPMLARLAAYVKNGGTLVVGGGPFAYGCGGYEGSFLEEMLPVKTRKFDCLPAHAADRDGRTAVAVEGAPDVKLFWIQKDAVKPGAEVLLKTVAGDPLLVKGTYGRGLVYAFLGTPLGDEARDAKVFWNQNEAYLGLMRGVIR